MKGHLPELVWIPRIALVLWVCLLIYLVAVGIWNGMMNHAHPEPVAAVRTGVRTED